VPPPLSLFRKGSAPEICSETVGPDFRSAGIRSSDGRNATFRIKEQTNWSCWSIYLKFIFNTNNGRKLCTFEESKMLVIIRKQNMAGG